MWRHLPAAGILLAPLGIAALAGCDSLQLNLPIQMNTLEQGQAALLVTVANRSKSLIQVTYPIQSTLLYANQDVTMSFPKPGNYTVQVTVYERRQNYQNEFKQTGILGMPVFLNGQDVIAAGGRVVGRYIEVTDAMAAQVTVAR